MMGPTEQVLLDKDGNEMYLEIRYKRSGKTHTLRVPKRYSSYFARSPIFIKHPFGEYFTSYTSICSTSYVIFQTDIMSWVRTSIDCAS